MHLTRRQKEILDFLGSYIDEHGYAPTIEEIGHHFGLSSLATVHKHLTNLQEKGLVKRAWNRSRALELVPSERRARRSKRSSRPRPSSSPRTCWAGAKPTCSRSRATR
jgi:repressor LexA